MFLFSRWRSCAPCGRTASLCFGLALIALFSVQALALEPSPEYELLTWVSTGPSTHEVQFGPTTGQMSFTTAGDDIVYPRILNATNRDFAARYASQVPAMWFENGASGSAANGLAEMTFTPPLPAGSQLIVFDVDIANRNERIQISSVGATLALLMQLEAQEGASSVFPTWNPTTGVLQSVRSNSGEATVLDVAGAQSLAMRYLRNGGGSGVTGIQFAIAVPVPEPGAGILLGIALATCWRVPAAMRLKGIRN